MERADFLTQLALALVLVVVLGMCSFTLLATWLWLCKVLKSQWKKVQHGVRLARARLEEQSASPPGDGGVENSRDITEALSREGPSPGTPQASLGSLSSPGSPSAVATGKGELMLELLQALQAQQKVTQQCCRGLQAKLAQWQGVRGTHGGTPPREPSHSLGRMEAGKQVRSRVEPPRLGAEDMNEAEDGELGRNSDVGPGKRSPMELESRDEVQNLMDVQPPLGSPPTTATEKGEQFIELVYALQALKVKKEQAGRSSSMVPERSSTVELSGWEREQNPPGEELPSSRPPAMDTDGLQAVQEEREKLWEPEDRERGQVSTGMCPIGQWLRQGCARLWGYLKGCWRQRCRPQGVHLSKPPWWQRWF